MDQVKTALRVFWTKVVEKKDIVIPVATAVVGAVIGVVVTAIATREYVLYGEDLIDEV